ncbi:pentatricopeptide repeat-containing protein At1g03560, mitochondrial [Impatiens glandulifera]|uniref:pentatricopeptide repeat-containing protein At1g03560, mitochondrial n=1 Tax=Impatiens glandulifera TaxID=253017 RepID=UPI001FB05E82|nr:pentatricopeptide repeat-containing protein At1g03560, mitochondrial [Impatiens glandulifera]XP_047338462.1 pentatricopeptide repeat-containing protein At1g03560, mitochondrial [Impatiens glandulifera]
MKKALAKSLFSLTTLRWRHLLPCHDSHFYGALLTNRKCVFTYALPPPEWVQPFSNLSDIVKDPKNLQPSPWVNEILNLLNNSSANMEHDLDSYCRKFLIRLPPSFVAVVLHSDEVRRQFDAATRFFYWAGKQKGYAHNIECFVALFEILAKSKDLNRIQPLFSEFVSKGLLMNVSAANSLIRTFGNLGMVEELLWVWSQMNENGIEPSLYTFNFLMNGLVNSMFIESAEKVFEVMEVGKIRPDVVTYNIMIKGYCKVGKTQKAVEKFRDMELIGNLDPDKITYMTIIQAHYGEGDFDSCLNLYHEMDEKEIEIPPHAYSLVISGLCKNGKPNEAQAVLDKMNQRGCKANIAIFTSLIDAFGKNNDTNEALIVFEKMKDLGMEPDEVAYGSIVNILIKSGRLDEAMKCFESCERNNAVTYSIAIDGLGKVGRVEEAESLFEEMIKKGCTPDSYCYNAIIDAYTKNGRIEDAIQRFEEMEGLGCNRSVYTYTIIINGLFLEHRNEEALRMWGEMIDKGITPNDACCRAVSIGLCLSGKVGRACKILDQLAPMGVIPDNMFEDMIKSLCKVGRIREACKLADGIVDRGREIPGKVRSMLLNALRKSGNADLALKLMHSKIGIGYDRRGSVKRPVKFRILLEN